MILKNNIPSIDLHGEDRVNALIRVSEFIDDSIKLKNKYILIIHGKGSYILKNAIHEYLKRDKRVCEYSLDINVGQTIVNININND